MIEKLRKRFIRLAVVILAGAILFVTAALNLANLFFVNREIASEAEALKSGGTVNLSNRKEGRGSHEKNAGFRYFQVRVADDGTSADVTKAAGFTEEDAEEMALEVLETSGSSGFIDDCYYTVTSKGKLRMVFFLDCSERLEALRTFAALSALVSAVGIAAAAVLVVEFSGKAVRPFAENDEKQKRFITDASHELKTPLSVIAANMDVLRLDLGENEWVDSTSRQVGTMKRLVNDLVYLARSNEKLHDAVMTAVDLSALVTETAEPFALAAEAKGQTFRIAAEPGITLTGDAKEFAKVVSVLCDNAVKYAPEGDGIVFSLAREKKYAVLQTVNTVGGELTEAKTKHLFDRFYRADEARTHAAGGGESFGIGLAIVRAVCEKYGGFAEAKQDGSRLVIRCALKTER